MIQKLMSGIKQPSLSIKKLGWRKILIGFVFSVFFLIFLSPELALFSFLLDATLIDLIILFAGLQLAQYWGYAKYVFSSMAEAMKALLQWVRDSRLFRS